MLFLGVFFATLFLYATVSNTGWLKIPAKTYDIEKWMTLSELNATLELGISSWRYKLWIRFFAEKPTLQAGQYVVTSGTTLSDFFLKNLKRPTYTDTTITIIPGWNIYDIDQYLSSKWLSKTGDVIATMNMNFALYEKDFPFLKGKKSLEGFLYPDTYRIKPKSSVDSILRILLGEWQNKIWADYASLWDKAYNTLILASIVEREERNKKNQPIVAGILQKRHDEWIPIGADATVCYGYAKTHKDCTPAFIANVINQKNPYNTRNMRGYTPTPISTITKETWDAAMNPESSSYYYYLHDNDWIIHYAETLEGHVANKQKYLQ